MVRSLALAACLALAVRPAPAQTAATVVVSGTVSDAESGEVLIGATVYAPRAGVGVSTNAYGFFSLPLPADSTRIVVSYVGYAPAERVVGGAADARLDVALQRADALGEVVVEADDGDVGARPEATPQMGQVALTGRDVRGLPALLGEADVLKAVQLLPGVRGGQEGTAGLYVRGGSPDQTLLLLDGVPVYNASHLFGFLSTFNGDAVSRVELTKGAYPARFGGRLGSVLDVRLRDGDLEQRRVQGQVGILSTRLLAEGPIVPGKASFLVSGRRTYIDLVARPFIQAENRRQRERGGEEVEPRAYFYDLNAKLNWRPSDRDRVYLSLYGGADVFGFESVDPYEDCFSQSACVTREDVYGGGLDWGNLTGSLRYTRALSARTFGALTLTASDYAFDVGVDVEEGRGGLDATAARVRYRSGIRDYGARLDLDVAAGRGHTLRLGTGVTAHRFTPGALSLTGELAAAGVVIDTLLGSDRSVGLDAVAYAEDEWRVGRRLTLGLGLHGALYASGGAVYPSVEPRVSASLQLAERLAVKASAAVTQQPLHLLTSGAGIGLPADLWVPATERVAPQRGRQVAVGLAGSSPSGATTWTVEGYWREMRGLVAYREGAAFTTPFDDWEDLVVTGDGRSRGLEVFVQHRADRLTTWLGYTLAKTDRQFDALNGGERFPFRYDRRHDLSTVALYELSKRFDVSAAFVFGTGDAVTLPVAEYQGTGFDGYGGIDRWINPDPYGDDVTVYGSRNGFRLPAYVRADLGITLYFRRGPRPHALALNVYNATNQKNPFLTLLDDEVDPDTGERERSLVGVALFPVLPTLSYQFAF